MQTKLSDHDLISCLTHHIQARCLVFQGKRRWYLVIPFAAIIIIQP